MDYSRKLGTPLARSATLLGSRQAPGGRPLVGGRPAPPPPPSGPISRVSGSLLMRQPAPPPERLGPRIPFGLPSLRRNVCPHFYMTGPRGPIHIQAPHLLKALMRADTNVARCQLRGGVHLEHGYVSDICLSSRFNQCVFYEDELSR